MSLFGNIVSAIGNQALAASGPQGKLIEAVMSMVNHPEVGGINGLVQKLSQGGLKSQVASWIGTGQNLPITAAQLQAVLGSTGLQAIAAKFGLHTEDAAGQLATLLPQLIDKLSPNGQLPAESDMAHQVLAGLSGLLGHKA